MSISHLSRRQMLARAGTGFGMLGMLGSLQSAGLLTPEATRTHFAPKAKRVIFLFMNGAPSHVDTFDPQTTALAVDDGKKPVARQTTIGQGQGRKLMQSPWKFPSSAVTKRPRR